jgi:biotin carboxylase
MRDRGVETVVVDHDPSAIAFEHASRRAVVSTEDEPAVERLARAEGVEGIVSPGADWTVGVAARVAERVGLPHPIDAATAGLATNKQRQRAALAAFGIPQPAFRPVGRYEDGLPVPCVVKAADRQGQRGLTLVRSAEELRAAVEEALLVSRHGTAIVEEVVDGPEVTVNAVSVDGRFVPLTVTDRLTAEPPAFGVAVAHAWPSEHDVSEAVEVAAAAVEALGIRNGPTYTQVRLGAHGARVMEVAARLGGGHDAELCLAALGVDLNRLALDFALGGGLGVGSAAKPAAGACVVFLVPPEGELVATHGAEEARSVEGVLDVLLYRRPGHVFGPLRRGPDRAGAILAVGDSRDDALARAGRAAEAVRFEVA